jgi:hypothetical protein
MIIKGKSRGDPSGLAAHLGNEKTNDRVKVIETRGTVADDLRGALIEMDAYAAGTQCSKPLYHANIDWDPAYTLTLEQQIEAVNALEEKLGLAGQPRVIVQHEKHGRVHLHPVWARIDLEKNRAVSDSHNYRKHEECARDLERRFGHDRVQGAHHERDGVERPDRTPSRAELRQEERTGIKGKDVKADITAAFRNSDNAQAFKTAVEDKGYLIARGDRRDFVIVDRAGGIHSLARRLDGVKAAELRTFMKPIDMQSLPSASAARDAQIDLAEGRRSALDERKWEDGLREAGLEKEKLRVETERTEAKAFREKAIAWEAERTWERRMERASAAAFKEEAIKWEEEQKRKRTAHRIADKQTRYSHGDGYANQTGAALDEHKERERRARNKNRYRPQNPSDHAESVRKTEQRDADAQARQQAEEEVLRRQADETTRRQEAERAKSENTKSKFSGTAAEMTDVKLERLNRLLNPIAEEDHEREHPDPDRQREAPGGGRTRSR